MSSNNVEKVINTIKRRLSPGGEVPAKVIYAYLSSRKIPDDIISSWWDTIELRLRITPRIDNFACIDKHVYTSHSYNKNLKSNKSSCTYYGDTLNCKSDEFNQNNNNSCYTSTNGGKKRVEHAINNEFDSLLKPVIEDIEDEPITPDDKDDIDTITRKLNDLTEEFNKQHQSLLRNKDLVDKLQSENSELQSELDKISNLYKQSKLEEKDSKYKDELQKLKDKLFNSEKLSSLYKKESLELKSIIKNYKLQENNVKSMIKDLKDKENQYNLYLSKKNDIEDKICSLKRQVIHLESKLKTYDDYIKPYLNRESISDEHNSIQDLIDNCHVLKSIDKDALDEILKCLSKDLTILVIGCRDKQQKEQIENFLLSYTEIIKDVVT